VDPFVQIRIGFSDYGYPLTALLEKEINNIAMLQVHKLSIIVYFIAMLQVHKLSIIVYLQINHKGSQNLKTIINV
jgi:hypothetical protein